MAHKHNKGSEWRKWDLHVHTPESGMANGFNGDWDNYVKILFDTAIKNDVAVLGITDYFTIDGYKKLKEEYYDDDSKLLSLFNNDQEYVNKIRSIRLFPNIEFRLKTLVNNRRINYHVIFSDEVLISDIEENFLHDIEFVYENTPFETSSIYKLKKRNIEELGKKLKQEQDTFRGSNFEIGCSTAIVCDEQIRQLLTEKQHKFKDKYIIGIPIDEDLSSINWRSQEHHVRKLLYQQTNIFFTSNSNTVKFGLGEMHSFKSDFITEFKTFKPSIIGSDAHSITDIKNKLGQHYVKYNDINASKIDFKCKTTWIKADSTFNGLRQILFEPEDRVRIQLSKPEQKVERLIISSLQFDSDDSLFGNQEIFLNPNLNSIIGGKSSGKSLLLHSTASAIDKGQVERISSALKIDEYKSSFDYDLIVKWGDGVKNSMNTKPNEDEKRRITYIPQHYINYLAEKDNKEELNQLILNILLQNEDMRNEYNQKKDQIEETSTLITSKLSELQNTWNDGIFLRSTYREIGEEKAIQKSIDTLKIQIDNITKLSTLSPEEQKKYGELRDNVESLIKQKQNINTHQELSNKVYREVYDISTTLCGITDNTGNIVQVGKLDNLYQLYNDIPQELHSVKDKIKDNILKLTNVVHQDIIALNLGTKLKEIETQITQNNKSLEPFIAKLKNLDNVKKIQDNYNVEIIRLEKSKAIKVKLDATVKAYRIMQEEIGNLLQKRYSYYLDVKKFVNEKYNSIGEGITLELDVSCNLNNFAFYQQINKTKIDNAHLFNSLFSAEKVVYDKVPPLFKNIKKRDNTENAIELKDSTIKYPLNQGVELFEVYKGLAIDNFELNFEVKYLKDSLLKMSPGKKGTVLLILFLQISSSEYPILIDQPEDNLDNRTIYDLLCQIIRAKKKDRQIIIVSHNANLVVATDSENIIVANQEGQIESACNTTHRFEYINGALESTFVDNVNSGVLYQKNIKGHVCDILEGGDEAFKHREKKYF